MKEQAPRKRPKGRFSNKTILMLFLIMIAAGFWFRTSVDRVVQQQSEIVTRTYQGLPTVIDANTVDFNGTRLRIEGYVVPDRTGPASAYFEQANATIAVAAEEPWVCTDTGNRSGERIVAVCEFAASKSDIGLWIVRAGYGVDWPEFSGGRYAAAEAEARRKKTGVWQTLDKSWIE